MVGWHHNSHTNSSSMIADHQSSSWQMEKLPNFINISEIATKMVLQCSVYNAPPNEPHIGLLSWVSTKFTRLSMLFIFELACAASRQTSSRKSYMLNHSNLGKKHARNERLGWSEGILYHENEGNNLVLSDRTCSVTSIFADLLAKWRRTDVIQWWI